VNENEKQRLRALAEAELARHGTPRSPSEADAQYLLHHLQVHEIELEMQNEALRTAHEDLEKSRDRYLDLYEFAPLGYFTLNADGLIIECNLTAVTMLGIERHPLTRSHFTAWMVPADQARWTAAFLHLKKQGDKSSLEVTMRRRDGTPFQAHLDCERRGNPSEAQADSTVRVILQDITARKQSEDQLKQAASVFSHAHEGIIITKTTGEILDINAAFTLITGYSREEVLGRNPRFLRSGQHDKAFYAEMWRQLKAQGYWSGEIWNRRKSGEVYPELLTISTVPDEQGRARHYVGLFVDITAQKEYERELKRVAHYDALTGLPNRWRFAELMRQHMQHAEERNQRLAIAYLDLDRFKAINDRYGHAVGDQFLIAIAERMKESLRQNDTIARLGGDEFSVILPMWGDTEASESRLTRLLEAVAEPVRLGDLVLQASASIGVTFFPQRDTDADQLLRQADHSMYQAKLAGKNCYHFFNAEQDLGLRSYHENLANIRQALITNTLALHYQPKVNMRTGAVVGVEALIRWQHPEKGLLPPSDFLPLIEGQPLAIELGEWVLETVLKQMEQWKAGGLEMPVSVNLAAIQFEQPNFVERLTAILQAHPTINPAALELEILETTALEDWETIAKVIADCGSLGIRFALDDFGTGYSSLTYLKRLPVAVLKIDQTFVHDMHSDPDNLAILVGIIGLAVAFRREVIAEGVERVEQGEMLLQLGCELAQGYFIAHPMPGEELPTWVQSWTTDPIWSNRPPLSRALLPLLFASVEYRSWLASLTAFLSGKREAPPPFNYHQCRLGVWLDTIGLAHYGNQPVFQLIESLHRAVHSLAMELLQLHAEGQNTIVSERMSELIRLGESLLEHLAPLASEPDLPPMPPLDQSCHSSPSIPPRSSAE
jgi:diguanylate cyclase (GGDEF)-like protein/PAS domain S-box-containing protein